MEAKQSLSGDGGLMIGGTHDPAEKAADETADRVMRMPASKPVVRRKCEECEEKEKQIKQPAEKPEGEELVQAKPAPKSTSVAPGVGTSAASPGATASIQSLGGGKPLAKPERAFFEPRLNADLSSVRVHDGVAADRASRGISARAFALGNDIAFAAGEHQPGTETGRHLMAHELAHVVQNRGDVHRSTVRRACDSCPSPVNPDVTGVKVTPLLKSKSLGGELGLNDSSTGKVKKVSIAQREKKTCNTCAHGSKTPNEWELCPKKINITATVEVHYDPTEIKRKGGGGELWHMDCDKPADGTDHITPASAAASMTKPKRVTVRGIKTHEKYHTKVTERLLRARIKARNDVGKICPYKTADIKAWKAALETTIKADAEAFIKSEPTEPNEEENANKQECKGY